MLSPAINKSSAAQKIGAAYRLHLFSISLHKALLWRFNSQKQFPHTSCHWFQLHTFYGKTTPFPCISSSLIHRLLSLSFELHNGQKIGVFSKLHLFSWYAVISSAKGFLDYGMMDYGMMQLALVACWYFRWANSKITCRLQAIPIFYCWD